MTWFAPSVLTSTGAVHDAISESVSEQLKLTVTSLLFHPALFAEGDCDGVMVGAVLSIFTASACAVSRLPARSVAKKFSVVTPSFVMVKLATFPGVAVLAIGWAPVAVAVICFTPLPPVLSTAVSVTVVSLLFQPPAFGWGETATVVPGETTSLLPNCCSATGELTGFSDVG